MTGQTRWCPMESLRRAISTCCLVAYVLGAGGCAGSGEGLDANGRPLDEGGGGEVPLTPDLASIQANVFTPVCTSCHSGAAAAQGLQLDAASSFASLVGVPSAEVPSLLRVEPGNPDNSYLVQKLEGRASVGGRMPLGQPALPAATIQVIRQWISDGALPATGSDDGQTLFAIKAISATPDRIAVGFARAIDATLVNSTTVQLEQVSGGLHSSIAADASVSPHNDALLLLVPRAPLRPGTYRMMLRGTAPVALADWNAMPLDGDADGRPGGDFTSTIEIGGDL